MRRRNLMTVLAGAAAYPLLAGAQQKAMPVIGYLGSAPPSTHAPRLPAFHQSLNETGYVEGQNVAIEYRWDEGRYDRLPALAADLVGRKVDVIVAPTINAALAAKSATSTIPIVFVAGDPVTVGLVASFAPAGRQRHRLQRHDARDGFQAARAAFRAGSAGRHGRRVGQPDLFVHRGHD